MLSTTAERRDQPDLLHTINLAVTLHWGTAAPLDIISIGVARCMMQYCACESLDGGQHGRESASNGPAAHSTEPSTQTIMDKGFKVNIHYIQRKLSDVLAVEGASRMNACYEDGTVAKPCHGPTETGLARSPTLQATNSRPIARIHTRVVN